MPMVVVKKGRVEAGGTDYGVIVATKVRKPRERRPFPDLPVDGQLAENLSEERLVEVTFFQQEVDRRDEIIRRNRRARRGGDRTKLMIGDRRRPL